MLSRGGGPPQRGDLTAALACQKTSQHQTSTGLSGTCGKGWATPPLLRSLCAVSTSTPKPRAGHRRRSAACGGCHSMRKIAFAIFLELAMPTPSQLVGDWQGGPAAADRAGHRKRACEASSSPPLHFRHAMVETASPSRLLPSFLTRLHPPPTAATPSSTQNAPGFAFFGLFRVRFFHFRCFSGRKIFALVFVHPAV